MPCHLRLSGCSCRYQSLSCHNCLLNVHHHNPFSKAGICVKSVEKTPWSTAGSVITNNFNRMNDEWKAVWMSYECGTINDHSSHSFSSLGGVFTLKKIYSKLFPVPQPCQRGWTRAQNHQKLLWFWSLMFYFTKTVQSSEGVYPENRYITQKPRQIHVWR